MRLLVIGGAGFIGSRIVRRLLSDGDQVICFDVMPRPELFPATESQLTHVRGDVIAIEQVIDAIQIHRPDAIVNMAYLLGWQTQQRPHAAARINIDGMNNVFEAARLTGIRRVVFASSIAVYGPQAVFGDRPVNEDDLPRPVWVYGGHKQFNEYMALKYRELYDMEIVAVRVATAYGFGREQAWGGWPSQIITDPAVGRPLHVTLPSSQPWPLVFVEDVADLFVRVCRAPSVAHTVYGTGGETTLLGQLAAVVREFVPDAQITFDESASPLPNLQKVESRRAEEEFGYRRRPISDGVKQTILQAQQAASANLSY